MASYVQITQDEMAAAVGAFKRPPDRTSHNPNQEIVHDWHVGARNNVGPKLSVRLYTSVVPNAGARACGKDAIRVAVVASPYTRAERLLFTLKRVHRTPGWEQRMRERLVQAWCLIRSAPVCPACGARMSPCPVRTDRANRHSPVKRLFWSCTVRSCKGSRSAQKVAEGERWRPPRTYDELLNTLMRN